jgi:GntR family transcriptional repressor for pyruvate dehydrogenase complex
VNDVLGVLDALDEAVIRDAAAHRRARDLRDLDSLLRKLAKAWPDPVEGRHCTWRLRRRIAEITPNAVLRAFYLNLVDDVDGEGVPGAPEAPAYLSGRDERLKIHYDIVTAIRSQDQNEVRRVVLRHGGN